MEEAIVIGAGAAGLSAALELADSGARSVLVSDMPSQRSQSVMAEGGINAATSAGDSPELHAEDTLRAGRFLADPAAVRDLTRAAPAIVDELLAAGTSFSLDEDGTPAVRAFGGQSVERTHFAAACTGKQVMQALIAQVRRHEASGMVRRLTGWRFVRLLRNGDRACGCVLANPLTGETTHLTGRVIVASGGMNGLFGNATGSVRNDGGVTASLFAEGVAVANGEFIQYHPTTARLRGKNMLISEAVRGEGGRLFTMCGGERRYFMEERYPELGNLMPRDVVAREEWAIIEQGGCVWLDMTRLDEGVRRERLSGVAEDCRRFLSLDPAREPIPVEPGIHYFMGGIRVDRRHRTDIDGLYAAGECCCQYHGANRLGGNSLLGAVYGGKVAARSVMEDGVGTVAPDVRDMRRAFRREPSADTEPIAGSFVDGTIELRRIMRRGMGIARSAETLREAIDELDALRDRSLRSHDPNASAYEGDLLANGMALGRALLMSAEARRESRGAHARADFPAEDDAYLRQTVARRDGDATAISFEGSGDDDAN